MINLSDFLLLKSKSFHQQPGFYWRYSVNKVHAILIEEVTVQTTLRDGASFRGLSSTIGLKYLH